jgi:DNA-directed RNA polymerase subunit RPC12/RpoP
MAIERLKFRCYRCNQLLGSTPSKAGSVVTCPKCSAELLIPVPELRGDVGAEADARAPAPAPAKVRSEPRPRAVPEFTAPPESATTATAVQPAPRAGQAPAYVDEITASLPPDLIDLKPEDLRVEAEFFESLTRQSQVPVVREPAPWPQPESLAPSFASESFALPLPIPIVVETAGAPSAAVGPPVLTETVDLAPRPAEPPAPVPVSRRAETAAVGTAIEIEHPTIMPQGTEIRRVSEVVLPASVVLSWSLFALIGIALSFVAGLLMGHFLWKVH